MDVELTSRSRNAHLYLSFHQIGIRLGLIGVAEVEGIVVAMAAVVTEAVAEGIAEMAAMEALAGEVTKENIEVGVVDQGPEATVEETLVVAGEIVGVVDPAEAGVEVPQAGTCISFMEMIKYYVSDDATLNSILS